MDISDTDVIAQSPKHNKGNNRKGLSAALDRYDYYIVRLNTTSYFCTHSTCSSTLAELHAQMVRTRQDALSHVNVDRHSASASDSNPRPATSTNENGVSVHILQSVHHDKITCVELQPSHHRLLTPL